jgi:hypothetical protein
MLKATIAKIRKQPPRIEVTQSPNVIITTTGVETVVTPSTNIVRSGVLIGSTTNLGHGSNIILARRNLSWSLGLPAIIFGVVGTPQMVFINPIMTTHVNRTTNRPPMSSMVIRKYKSTNAKNPRGY